MNRQPRALWWVMATVVSLPAGAAQAAVTTRLRAVEFFQINADARPVSPFSLIY